jgi:murein DD-endopeptidase MepM/ murein hydrolase activator NlpD
MSEKFLTILVVPHNERNVRRLRLSYRLIRILTVTAVVVGFAAGLGFLMWGRIASRAARAGILEQENRRLAEENAKVTEIAANLERSEQAYRQIRTMAGLEQGSDASSTVGVSPAAAVEEAPAEPPTRRPPELGGVPGSQPSGWPLTVEGFVTAEYAGRGSHPGVDIAVPLNTPVVATAGGTVKQTGRDAVYGHFIVVVHADGIETMYAHNGHLLVERGARVSRGEIIAYSGNSGRSSAPHLHYEVRREGLPVDPTPFLR